MLQMISAVGYLHKNSVYHGSLSLESFKFRANMEMYLDLEQSKIIDSSFSQVEPDEANYHIKNYEYYSSPEVLEAISNTEFGGTFDAYKSDVWALAILMQLVLTSDLSLLQSSASDTSASYYLMSSAIRG